MVSSFKPWRKSWEASQKEDPSKSVKLALKFDCWPSSGAPKDPKKHDCVPPLSRAYNIPKSNDKKALVIDSFRHNLNKSGDRDDNSEITNRKSRLPIFALIAQEKE